MAIDWFLISVGPLCDSGLPMESRLTRNRKDVRLEVIGAKPGVSGLLVRFSRCFKYYVRRLKAGVKFLEGKEKRPHI
jgi:hypothetical protein